MKVEARSVLLSISGLIFLVAGAFQLAGFFPLARLGLLKAVGLGLILAGLALMVSLYVKEGGACLLLAASIFILVMASVGPIVVPFRATEAKVETLDVGEVGPVSELSLSCHVGLGSLEIRTVGNTDFYVKVVYWAEEEVLKYQIKDGLLVVNLTVNFSAVR